MQGKEEIRLFGKEGVFLILRRGENIFLAGEYLSDRAFLMGDTLDGIQNFAGFIGQDKVAVLAHDFQNQIFCSDITHFVGGFNPEDDDTIEIRLHNIYNFAACDMLAHDHAE